MSKLIVICGPPGSGKSTVSKRFSDIGYVYINQDDQGKEEHLKQFYIAINSNRDVIVDRMNFNKQQRSRYINIAKQKNYNVEIIVLHESYDTCYERMLKRENHPTIKTKEDASKALDFFFSKYERVEDSEADEVLRVWPQNKKLDAIVCDLDGTLCNIEHRRQYVQNGNKDWRSFFLNMDKDLVNKPVMDIINKFSNTHEIVYCSGRPDSFKDKTVKWLEDNNAPIGNLFMRRRNDFRQDNIIKEVILDFELLTRYNIEFCLDDRNQVVKMFRDRGITVLQVADGDF